MSETADELELRMARHHRDAREILENIMHRKNYAAEVVDALIEKISRIVVREILELDRNAARAAHRRDLAAIRRVRAVEQKAADAGGQEEAGVAQ